MKNLVIGILVLFSSLAGQAVSTVLASTDYRKDFLNPYKFFITPIEEKAFKKLTTDEERNRFIEDFWINRNPDCDPAQPREECLKVENKVKNKIDERLKNVEEDKIFSTDPDTFGLRFSANGGIVGDLAHVYLLHDVPDWKNKLEGQYFSDMVLWIYLDDRGNEKYHFLFYRRHDVGSFQIFRPIDFFFPPVQALEEISRFGRDEEDVQRAWNELAYEKAPDSIPFVNAMMEFSQTGKRIDEALASPTAADIIAKRHNMTMVGTLPKAKNLKIPSSSASSIPASLRYYPGLGFRLLGVNSDFDWFEEQDRLACYLFARATFQDENDPQKEIPPLEAYFKISNSKEYIENNLKNGITFEIPGLNKIIQDLPSGTYTVNVYIRSTVNTAKYSAYQETIKK